MTLFNNLSLNGFRLILQPRPYVTLLWVAVFPLLLPAQISPRSMMPAIAGAAYLEPEYHTLQTADGKWKWNHATFQWELDRTSSCADAGGGFQICLDKADDKSYHVNPNWIWN